MGFSPLFHLYSPKNKNPPTLSRERALGAYMLKQSASCNNLLLCISRVAAARSSTQCAAALALFLQRNHRIRMTEPPAVPNTANRWLTRGVLGIGLASLFSDWGHEAATAILPAFLASLGAPAFALGVIEGVSDGVSSFAKLVGGWIADRRRWRKPTGIVGYCATGLSTFGYAFAHSWPSILVLRAAGWAGRGGRGPSRDTLLTDAVAPRQLGRAFGFERAMDTAGAVLGPLCATLLVGVLGFRRLFRWTVLPGLLAAFAFAFLAPSPSDHGKGCQQSLRAGLRELPVNFRRYLIGVFTHGIGDFAPTLLILRAMHVLTPGMGAAKAATFATGLYTFLNIVSAVATYPAGALGDRFGKRGLLVIGYLFGTATYAGFIFERPTLPALSALFALAGIHIAMQQSLEKSLAAELLPAGARGSGFGALATVNGIGDLVSSVVVGALWSGVSATAGFAYAATLAFAGAALIYSSHISDPNPAN
jgi:MFS family permease